MANCRDRRDWKELHRVLGLFIASIGNFKPATTLPLDNNFAVQQTQFDLPSVTTSHIRLFGDQCCALQAAAGAATRNVFASVDANGCRRWIEVGLKHARMIRFALGQFKRRVCREARKLFLSPRLVDNFDIR
jgi:hypothetical protein